MKYLNERRFALKGLKEKLGLKVELNKIIPLEGCADKSVVKMIYFEIEGQPKVDYIYNGETLEVTRWVCDFGGERISFKL